MSATITLMTRSTTPGTRARGTSVATELGCRMPPMLGRPNNHPEVPLARRASLFSVRSSRTPGVTKSGAARPRANSRGCPIGPQSCRSHPSIPSPRPSARGKRNRPMDRPERPEQSEPSSIFSKPDPLDEPAPPPAARSRTRSTREHAGSDGRLDVGATCPAPARGVPAATGRHPSRRRRRQPPVAPDARRPRRGRRGRHPRVELHRLLDPRERQSAAGRRGGRLAHALASPSAEPTPEPTPERPPSRRRSRRRPARRPSWPWVTGRR